MRLDAAALIRQGSDEHKIVIEGQPAESELIQRVTTHDEGQLMPPKDEGVRLKPEEVLLVERSIKAGMPAPADETYVASPRDHWSYRPVERPQLPDAIANDPNANAPNVNDANAIDRWLSMLQYQRELRRDAAADPATWLRRVTLDYWPAAVDRTTARVFDERCPRRSRPGCGSLVG